MKSGSTLDFVSWVLASVTAILILLILYHRASAPERACEKRGGVVCAGRCVPGTRCPSQGALEARP